MCFYIIKYVYSFQRTHISVCHFVGVFVYAGAINRPLRLRTDCHFVGTFIYAGTINRPLRLLTVCQLRGERIAITLRTPTKLVANIPLGVGADSSCPYPYVIKNVYFHN